MDVYTERDCFDIRVEPVALPKPLALCVMHKVEPLSCTTSRSMGDHFMSHMAMLRMRDNLDAEGLLEVWRVKHCRIRDDAHSESVRDADRVQPDSGLEDDQQHRRERLQVESTVRSKVMQLIIG